LEASPGKKLVLLHLNEQARHGGSCLGSRLALEKNKNPYLKHNLKEKGPEHSHLPDKCKVLSSNLSNTQTHTAYTDSSM
jgi:hypothetical protein